MHPNSYQRAESVHVLHASKIECYPVDCKSIEYRTYMNPHEDIMEFVDHDTAYIPIEPHKYEERSAPVLRKVVNGKEYLWSIVSPYDSFFEDIVHQCEENRKRASKFECRYQLEGQMRIAMEKKLDYQIEHTDKQTKRIYNMGKASIFKRFLFLFTGNTKTLE